nr:hypothetical protein [Catellatospora vulcania]
MPDSKRRHASITLPMLTTAAVAATAERSSTSADASLSRPSPSSTVITRDGAPRRLAMAVATASVGLTMAPTAMPPASPRPGIRAANSSPSSSEVITTRTTDRPLMAVKSRRKSIAGRETAAE